MNEQNTSLVWLPPVLPAAITNDDEFRRIGEMRGPITAWVTKVQEWFKPMKARWDQGHKAVCDLERDTLAPAKGTLAAINGLLKTYYDKKEAELAEAARLAREEAQRRQREAEEAARKLEAANQAEMAAKVRAEAEAESVPPPPTPPAAVLPKVQGLAFRRVRDYQITDKRALLQFCAAHEGMEELWEVSMPLLRQLYDQMQPGFSLPGVSVVEFKQPVSH